MHPCAVSLLEIVSDREIVADFFAIRDTRRENNRPEQRIDTDSGGKAANLIIQLDFLFGLEDFTPLPPPYLNQFGIEARYVMPETWKLEPSVIALKEKFGIRKELIQAYSLLAKDFNHETYEIKTSMTCQV